MGLIVAYVSLMVNLFSTKCFLFVYMYRSINPLPHMAIFGSTNLAAYINRDMMLKKYG